MTVLTRHVLVVAKTEPPASLDTLKISVPPAVKFAPCEPYYGLLHVARIRTKSLDVAVEIRTVTCRVKLRHAAYWPGVARILTKYVATEDENRTVTCSTSELIAVALISCTCVTVHVCKLLEIS